MGIYSPSAREASRRGMDYKRYSRIKNNPTRCGNSRRYIRLDFRDVSQLKLLNQRLNFVDPSQPCLCLVTVRQELRINDARHG